jgi:hypothetical protein
VRHVPVGAVAAGLEVGRRQHAQQSRLGRGAGRSRGVSKECTIASTPGPGRKPRPSTDPGPFRSRSLAPIGWIIAVVFAGAALLVYVMAPDYRPVKVRGESAADAPIPPPPALPPPKPVAQAEPDNPADVLGSARDFKAIFDRYRESTNPTERALAGRAHRACFPAFLPPQGKPPSPVYAINALSSHQHDARKAALQELYARCKSFLVPPLDAAEIVATSERVTNGNLASAGSAARWAMIRGDRATADTTVEQALRSREPYAIQSLSGLSVLMMNASAKGAQPEITDAALALLSCDLGASCGPNSLLALQLCAAEGRCQGSARERMLERIGPVDMEAVGRESKRLRALIDTGNANITTVWRYPR